VSSTPYLPPHKRQILRRKRQLPDCTLVWPRSQPLSNRSTCICTTLSIVWWDPRGRGLMARSAAAAAFSHLEPQLQLAATAKYSTVPPIRRASATIGQRGRFERGRSLQNALPRHPAVRWARPHFRPRSAAPGRLQGAAHHLGRGCSSCWPPESKRQMQQAPPYAFLTMATELERACNWPTNLQAPV